MDSSPATSQKRKEIEPDDTDPSLNKRPRVEPTESPSASASTSSSAPAAQPQSLATWLKVPPPPPLSSSLTSSNPIFDKDSIFIAYVLPITEKEASFKHIAGLIERLEHTHHKLPDVIAGRSKRGTGQTDGVAVPIKKKGIKPSHNMWAARHLALKKGATGTRPDDYEPREMANDDGETHGSERLLKVLRDEGASDVLLICSRWFGGTLIGPVRFHHIENCGREAVVEYTKMEQVFGLRGELEELDDLVDDLRAEIASGTETQGNEAGQEVGVKSGGIRPYRKITDAAKLERLIKAKSMTVRLLVEKVAARKIEPVNPEEETAGGNG